MNKSILENMKPGSARYVLTHAMVRRKRKKNLSKSYCGVNNPAWALYYAVASTKFETENESSDLENLNFGLYEEARDGPSQKEINEYFEKIKDEEFFKRELEKFLDREKEVETNFKYVALLSENNSLVIAQANEIELLFKKAQKRGVKNPFIVHIPQSAQMSLDLSA